ncbi:MAG: GTP cyclohydrolase I [Nitrospirae bacterium]|nr:GTP cyclohydrolase I [Nitrospirota bacterium]
MDIKLMREGLGKFVDSLDLHFNETDRDRVIQNVSKLWSETLLSGYREDPLQTLSFRQPAVSRDPVYITRLPFVSVCRDHLLPFSGLVSVGYVPDKEIIGLSNMGKLVQVLSARLQTQEQLTVQIAENLQAAVHPQWVGVYMGAQQYCMKARFPAQSISEVITTCFRGEDPQESLKREFGEIVRGWRK